MPYFRLRPGTVLSSMTNLTDGASRPTQAIRGSILPASYLVKVENTLIQPPA